MTTKIHILIFCQKEPRFVQYVVAKTHKFDVSFSFVLSLELNTQVWEFRSRKLPVLGSQLEGLKVLHPGKIHEQENQ